MCGKISISEDLKMLVMLRGITIESSLMRCVGLPVGWSALIEEKLRMDQEADGKRIEAQGISDFQKTMTAGINDNLFRWKGMEATLKIAGSNTTKVVIVGSGKDGLPVILDTKIKRTGCPVSSRATRRP